MAKLRSEGNWSFGSSAMDAYLIDKGVARGICYEGSQYHEIRKHLSI